MLHSPALALDLSLKILVAEDAQGIVTLTCSSAEFLIARYRLSPEAAAKVLDGAQKLAQQAAG